MTWVPRKTPTKVVFRGLGKQRGWAHASGVIEVDLADPYSNPLDTYVHECLHLQQPEWKERRVVREAAKIVRSLSQDQAVGLLRSMLTHSKERPVEVWLEDEEEEKK